MCHDFISRDLEKEKKKYSKLQLEIIVAYKLDIVPWFGMGGSIIEASLFLKVVTLDIWRFYIYLG